MKRKLHILVDSVSYIQNEVYQHQLHRNLVKDYNCIYHEIGSLDRFLIESGDVVFSALKLRTLLRHIDRVAQTIGNTKIIVQDYDPWVSFEDASPYKGAYHAISSKINAIFFVPSFEWMKLIRLAGFRCETSKIGMLPEYCDKTAWENRSIQIEFRGSHYPSRDIAMEKIFNVGFPNCWQNGVISPYPRFLEHLSNIRIWAFSDAELISVDGNMISKNALWPKCIEVLARGCFLIRDWQPEAENYVHDIPTAFMFKDDLSSIGALQWIQNHPYDYLNDLISHSINQIQNENYYQVISDRLQEWYDAHE